jgi:hypothetical protein
MPLGQVAASSGSELLAEPLDLSAQYSAFARTMQRLWLLLCFSLVPPQQLCLVKVACKLHLRVNKSNGRCCRL